MTYPRLIIDTNKIKHNTEVLVKLAAENEIEVAGVTKVFCANRDITKAIIEGGVKYLADSRIENMIKLKEFDLPKIFLRLPMLSQVDKVVEYADISLNSEVEVLESVSMSAIKQGKIHGIILMVDLGDLREGIYYDEEIFSTVDKIKNLKGIELVGIGTNLTCYGGVIPDENNIKRLVDISKEIEKRYGLKLQIISGGNSSSIHLLGSKALNGVNNLRLGESLVCGTETAYGKRIDETYDDAIVLEAEIIENKKKPSVPTGKIGMDAFGNIPEYVDRGIRKRAICAVGKQDLDDRNIIPFDEKIIIIGASSDHLIIDVTDCETNYQVGDIIKFKLKYSSILKTMTSAYVDKKII